MTKYQPRYTVLTPEMLRRPRDQITLVPEDSLDPLTRAELCNLRRGVRYSFVIADTLTNRENFNFKALYFQLVAYKEGWLLSLLENLTVEYVPPGNPRLPIEHHTRIMEFEKNGDASRPTHSTSVEPIQLQYGISLRHRLGFRIDEKNDEATQMKPEEADDLGEKIKKMFS